MKEYAWENGRAVDLGPMTTGFLPIETYAVAQRSLVLACHDIVVQYDHGALLVRRKVKPAKNELWTIGGRLLRGVLTEDSLRSRVRAECGLELTDTIEFSPVRVFWKTDPFGYGGGVDAIVLWYFGRGVGNLQLDQAHAEPTIVRPDDYTPQFRAMLHPYVQDFLDLAMPLIR